mgnify:CR=1 FL=1
MTSKWHETGLGCGMTRRTNQETKLSSPGLFEDLAQPSAEQVQQAQAEKAIKQGQGASRLLQPNRSQIELRASDLESLLAQDHRARLVWGYVMHQDLSKLIEAVKARGSTAGRAAIDPHILFALWLYATLQGVGSGRELARLSQEHDAYRWICGGVSVNYHALNDFRSGNEALMDELLSDNVAALAAAGAISLVRVAQDGMRVRADAADALDDIQRLNIVAAFAGFLDAAVVVADLDDRALHLFAAQRDLKAARLLEGRMLRPDRYNDLVIAFAH